MPQNALAPRNNRLLEEPPPIAGVFGPTVIPRQTVSDRLDQLSYGLGTGLVNQMKGYRQMALHPIQSTKELASALAAVAQDPRLAVNAMYGMWNKAASGPEGFGQVVGENISPRQLAMNLARKPVTQELITYHGTPHVFAPEEGAPLGRFRASKIGTGEGAQAYGHGIYVAESPDVAKQYAITRGVPDLEGMSTERGLNLSRDARVELMRQSKTDKDAISAARMLQNASRETRGLPIEKLADTIDAYRQAQKAQLYTVDLPDPMIERMLDWDKPLSEQPKAFRDAVAKLPRFQDPYVVSKTTGGEAYRELAGSLGSTAKASDLLRQQGIPGVKYLDAGSRDSAKGTRNFVVFPGEEQNLSILKRE